MFPPQAPFVPEFEQRFARYLGTEDCVSVQSGTAALHIALAEAGVGPGTRSLCPPFPLQLRSTRSCTPGQLLCLLTWTPKPGPLTPDWTEAAITPRTRAILPVHLTATSAAWTNWEGLRKSGDSSSSKTPPRAWEERGKCNPPESNFGCFSFNGNKLITTGGGGMVVARDRERINHIRFLVNQARDASKGYFHPEWGANYRMTNLEAALGLAQMERIDLFWKKADFVRFLPCPCRPSGGDSERASGGHRAHGGFRHSPFPAVEFRTPGKLKKCVPTRRLFSPLHTYPYLKDFCRFSYPQAEYLRGGHQSSRFHGQRRRIHPSCGGEYP